MPDDKESLFKPASKANTKLILAEEDNIQHILASLALKVTRQSVIIAKLSSYPRKNRTKKALWELDNLRRSLHLLNYVDSPQFQRNIQHALKRSTAASPITNWCARSRMPTPKNALRYVGRQLAKANSQITPKVLSNQLV